MIYIILVACYLIGAFPTGYVMVKLLKGTDIRQHGSGNIGFTNVKRVLPIFPAIMTLVIDIAKGFVAVYLAKLLVHSSNTNLNDLYIVVGGIMAIIGHNWPVYINFKGGKGVATGCGVFLAIAPTATLCAVVVWIVSVLIFNIVSISSILAVIVLPVAMVMQKQSMVYVGVGILISIMIIYRHRENIARIRRGEESEFIKRAKK